MKTRVIHISTGTTTTTTSILLITITMFLMGCLQTAMVAQNPTPAPSPSTANPDAEPESGAVFEISDPATPESALKCAIVTAIQSLNLRTEPNEKASVTHWLRAGEQVKIIGKVGVWWKIEADNLQGYAKANYLQESECE